MGIPYTSTPTSLTLVVGFRPTVIPSSHPNFAKLKELAADPATTEADIKPLLDIPSAIVNYTGGEITVHNGRLFYRGSEVKNNLATIILGFVKSGQPEAAEPFKKFLANCRQNPDLALVDTIYDWCVKSNMPITPEGEILAWKSVRDDYMSSHSGKRGRLRHRVGDVVTEPREECDPNRNQTCSTGIHFCSMEYLPHFGLGNSAKRIMAVVINPADITAIPTDYNLSKGRCCKLTVVGEVANNEDTVRGFYADSPKVYSGWSAPVPVRKTRSWTGGLRVGDLVRLRDGREVTLQKSYSSDVLRIDMATAVYVNNGRGYPGDDEAQDRPYDVIDVIRRAPATPRNSGGFAVGQVWAARNGQRRTISSINGMAKISTYPVQDTDGRVYTASGRFDSDSTVSQFDLVRLVTDVA